MKTCEKQIVKYFKKQTFCYSHETWKQKLRKKTEKISHNDSQNELQVEPVFSEYQIKSISCTKKKKRKATLNLTKTEEN